MKNLKLVYKIKAPIEQVWQALVNRDVIDEWGGGPATMNDQVGTEFKLWGGEIWGKNVEVVPRSRLVQEWYGGKWEKPSNVVFTVNTSPQPSPKLGEGETVVVLEQSGIPDEEYEAIREGWGLYYLGPMKKFLERVKV